MFKKISNSPLRKPLALLIFIIDIIVIVYCTVHNIDIRDNIKSLLEWINITILGGYFTTSTAEHYINSKGGVNNG